MENSNERNKQRRLILISNRLPLSLTVENYRISYQESIGGVAIGLGAVSQHFHPLWIGAVNLPREEIEDVRESIEEELREKHSCLPIFLSRDEIEGYYNGFSNSVLWPLFHGLLDCYKFPIGWWEQYKVVNRKFLAKIMDVAKPDDILWINDYHFLLLPGMIRREMGQHKIGFFLHIAFPEPHMFDRVPFRDELLEGVLGSDQVGVYTERYKRRLTACMENYLERKDSSASLEERRTPRVGVFQIGVDPVKIRELLKREPIQHLAQMLLSKFMGRKVILSADRLDYTKGILQKIEAYEVFLARHPEFKERVQLILIVGPCRMDLQVYNQLNQEISLLVQVINGKHGTSSWDPIYFINRTMPYEELLAYYRVADIALVTPLEDGMNLIAKEYLYVKGGEGGALILSKNAGAAVELQDAYQVDPTKIEEIASALRESLLASESDIISRNTKMLEHLVQQTVVKWMHDFVATLE